MYTAERSRPLLRPRGRGCRAVALVELQPPKGVPEKKEQEEEEEEEEDP